MSLMNNRKSLMYAIVAGALVFVIFGHITLKSSSNRNGSAMTGYQFVIAKTPIKKDDLIAQDNVELKNFAINIEGAAKAADEVVGKKANKDVEAGKPILKAFLQEVKVAAKDEEPAVFEPAKGYRAVPVLIKKSALPSYVSTSEKFDLLTRENSMKIENVKILDMLDPEDKTTKLLLLEIKDSDVFYFVKYQVKTKGFIFIQKNKAEYGEYRFDCEDYVAAKPLGKKNTASKSSLPPVPRVGDIEQIGDLGSIDSFNSQEEVELVVGNKKSKVKF